jgi:hypothetical protein
MGSLSDLILLLAIAGAIGAWLQLSRARERAAAEARRLCRRHGLQLLDDSVGLRGLRPRRLGGRLALERCYGFEVSIDGDDREACRLWMAGQGLTGYHLPTVATRRDDGPAPPGELPDAGAPPGHAGNVVPLRPRLRDRDTRH